MSNKPSDLNRLLLQAPHTSHLARMVARQQRLLEQVRSQLPPPLDRHCLHARMQGAELVLHVDSPVWYSRLRFHGNALLAALRAELPGLRRLRIRILQPQKPPAPRPRPKRSPPPNLDDLIADPELRQLLARLRNRRKPPTT